MFKNRAFQVKMVKETETPTYDTTVGDSLDAIGEMIAETAKPAAKAVVFVIAAKTISQIAVHAAKVYIR